MSRITSAVLDEAGTCPESKLPLLSLLPHLTRIISIGDHKQLSPFTYIQPGRRGNGGGGRRGRMCQFFARGRCSYGDNCRFEHASCVTPSTPTVTVEPMGFFQRVEKALPSNAIPSLTHQYRMNPFICSYISAQFYDHTLHTPEEVARERVAVDGCGMWWVDYPTHGRGHEEAPERINSTSKVNPTEVGLVVQIVQSLGGWGLTATYLQSVTA